MTINNFTNCTVTEIDAIINCTQRYKVKRIFTGVIKFSISKFNYNCIGFITMWFYDIKFICLMQTKNVVYEIHTVIQKYKPLDIQILNIFSCAYQ